MYAEFLRHEGLTPMLVSTAEDALIVAPRVDVIVTAIVLPGHLDGLEFLTRLRRADHTKSLPVIVLTAASWGTERESALAAGCDAFLQKPCLPCVLVREIRRALALRRVPPPRPVPSAHALAHRQRRIS
jgi:CheY-like chemotaxis protein